MNEKGSGKRRARRRAGLSREQRRQQILESAELLFAGAGLRSATTAALAKAAGTCEAILYRHYASKQELFEKAVERNTEQRLAALERRFSSIPNLPPLECIDRMAEATILACAGSEGNASVMAWALMETPGFAADVYRGEIGATEAMWDSEILRRFEGSPVRTRLAVHLVPYVVHACMAFGFWLTALRHKPATAQAHARQYADGVVDAARMALRSLPESFETAGAAAPPQEGACRVPEGIRHDRNLTRAD
ncbi:MAG: TetR/AcrR family transcriptional regulator [Candidatus Solibacter sp.]